MQPVTIWSARSATFQSVHEHSPVEPQPSHQNSTGIVEELRTSAENASREQASRHSLASARSRALRLVPEHASGKMPRFMLGENKQWYPLKDALKRTFIHVQWNQFLKGDLPGEESTLAELKEALNRELNSNNVSSESLRQRALRYIDKKINDFQFDYNDTFHTSYFLTKGTNLLSEVMRTEKGNFYQVATHIDSRLAALIEQQHGIPYEGKAKLIHKGSAGKIRLAEQLVEQSSIVVAAKTHRKDGIRADGLRLRKTDRKAILSNEANQYRNLPFTKHFSSVRDLAYVVDHKGMPRLYLFMDMQIRGNMINVVQMLEANVDLSLENKQKVIRTLAYQMIEAVMEMHEAGVCHGDIKPENFLFSKAGAVVLSDFGTASRYEAIAEGNTVAYLSSEAGTSESDKLNGDKYSLGRTLRAVWARFPDLNPALDMDLLKIADDLAAEDPQTRPALSDLLNHAYFQSDTYSDAELLALVDSQRKYVSGGAGGLELTHDAAASLPTLEIAERRYTPPEQRPYSPSPSNTGNASPRSLNTLERFLVTGQLPSKAIKSAPGSRNDSSGPSRGVFNKFFSRGHRSNQDAAERQAGEPGPSNAIRDTPALARTATEDE